MGPLVTALVGLLEFFLADGSVGIFVSIAKLGPHFVGDFILGKLVVSVLVHFPEDRIGAALLAFALTLGIAPGATSAT